MGQSEASEPTLAQDIEYLRFTALMWIADDAVRLKGLQALNRVEVTLRGQSETSDSRRLQGWPRTGPWPQAWITNDSIFIYDAGHARGISREDARRLAGELVRCDAELYRESGS